ncbi:MAG: tRNA-guanine transglycosylase DpdA [Candidatus Heimdallarchaeaceae archaeon]
MKYFIPEWDDLVSSHYDFFNDIECEDSKRVYAHELYSKANYDGILLSRMKVEENKSKFQKIKEVGAHKFFRFEGLIFGDCGAWGYIDERKPPFTTEEILSYYDDFGFDIGVSVDHLCLPNQNREELEYRLQLTIENAEKFFQLHEKKGYEFRPVGACQGWAVESYRKSVKEALDIGYDYIALGGLARTQTTMIIKILKSIQDLIAEKNIDVHIFGIARLEGIRPLSKLGVTSFDSASPLRSAWLSSKSNYRDLNWQGYSAVRLPFLTRDVKYKQLVADGLVTFEELEELEKSLLIMLRRFEFEENRSPEEIAEAFKYLNHTYVHSKDMTEKYLKTLHDKPWTKCPCKICKDTGMDVIIFRGNNRNRRRGFHNTWVFYKILQRILNEPDFQLPEELRKKEENLFKIISDEEVLDDFDDNIENDETQLLDYNYEKGDKKIKQSQFLLDDFF